MLSVCIQAIQRVLYDMNAWQNSVVVIALLNGHASNQKLGSPLEDAQPGSHRFLASHCELCILCKMQLHIRFQIVKPPHVRSFVMDTSSDHMTGPLWEEVRNAEETPNVR